MELSYKQKNTYQIICDDKGYAGCCYVVNNIDIYADKVYMVSTNTQTQISLDEMKKIISQIKN